MPKVLLICPPDDDMVQGAVPLELGKDRMGLYPPLGLMYIAAYTEAKDPRFEFSILDAITDRLSHQDVRNKIEQYQPDIVGINAYTFTILDALKVARASKEIAPKAHVLLGGFHAGIYREETLKAARDIDVVLAGEAEETFYAAVDRLSQNTDLAGIPGVSFRRKDGSLYIGPEMPFIANLDDLPFPDRTRVSYQKHKCVLGAQTITTNILSTRGCPFPCTYCYLNIKKYRMRSVDNVVAELKECLKLGIREFFFVDDLFNVSRKRVLEVSERLIKENLGIVWNARARVDQIDEELAEKMYKSGCTRIHFGVESGDPEILKIIRKSTDIKMIQKALHTVRKAGIDISSNIMIGLPGESPRHTEQSIRFALALPTNYVQAAIFTPYPNTPAYKDGVKDGVLPSDYWKEFALNPSPNFKPMTWPEFYTREQLYKKLRSFYRRFYFRPRIIWHVLKQINSWAAFKQWCANFQTFLILLTARESNRYENAEGINPNLSTSTPEKVEIEKTRILAPG